MLGANITMPQLAGFIYSQLNNSLSPGSQSGGTGAGLLTRSNNIFHCGTHFAQTDTHVDQDPGGYPLFLPYQTKKNMLGADIAMV